MLTRFSRGRNFCYVDIKIFLTCEINITVIYKTPTDSKHGDQNK